jgi:hypothetical protein
MPLISNTRADRDGALQGSCSVGRLLRSPYMLLLLIFAISRVVYYALGVRFDDRGLPVYLQFIDVDLLKHHLLQSLFYLHWQPPGYNLFLGIVLKLFPEPATYTVAFHIIHLMAGAVITCLLFYLMRCLGVGVRLAITVTALFMVSPGVILFENFLFYEYPIAFLLTVSAAFLFDFFVRRKAASAIGFLFCQFVLVMVRNQYHLVFMVAIFVLLLYFTKHNRRLVAGIGSLLMAAVLALYLKNLVLFGHFASSTWMEMGMGPLFIHQLTPEERQNLYTQGKLSPAVVAERQTSSSKNLGIAISAFYPYITKPPTTSIPVLDQEFKASGTANYNNIGYLEAQKLYKKDIRFILLHYPKAYFRGFLIAWFTYFLPPGDFPFFDFNLPHLRGIERFFDIIFFGQFKYTADRKVLRHLYAQGVMLPLILYTGIFLMIGLPTLFIFGTWFLYRGVRRRMLTVPQALLLGFLLFNIAYCTVTANFLSSYENNRYRFPVDGFYLILAALLLDKMRRKIFHPFVKTASTEAIQEPGPRTCL